MRTKSNGTVSHGGGPIAARFLLTAGEYEQSRIPGAVHLEWTDLLADGRLRSEDALEGLAEWNRRRAESILPRAFDPEGSIGITYEGHREAYDGIDREPEPLNPARVHQYEKWC